MSNNNPTKKRELKEGSKRAVELEIIASQLQKMVAWQIRDLSYKAPEQVSGCLLMYLQDIHSLVQEFPAKEQPNET